MPENAKQSDYRVEPLGQQRAGQDARRRVAAPFVLCEGQSNVVLGYYTLSALSIDVGAWPEDVARKLPHYPVVPRRCWAA